MPEDDVVDESLISDLVAEAKRDEVGLWFIVGEFETSLPDPARRRKAVLECVRRMLDSGEVVAADYSRTPPGYTAWRLSTDQAIARIDSEWGALGRDPSLGDIVVLVGRCRL